MSIIPSKKNIDEILEVVLAQIDQGRTQQDILLQFPEHAKELQKVFAMLSSISSSSPVPDKHRFEKAMQNILANHVTLSENSRYNLQKEATGRSSSATPTSIYFNNYLEKINNMMKSKILIPIGVVAVLAIIFVGVKQFNHKSPATEVADNTLGNQTSNLPTSDNQPATGNVDDTVNGIIASASSEGAYFDDSVKDGDLIATDSETLTNLGQAYDENEF